MKHLPFILIILLSLCAFGCESKKHGENIMHKENTSFFGDSVLIIMVSDHPQGYSITVLKNNDLCLWRFQRGDSINRYLALHQLPLGVESSISDSIGIFSRGFEIPTLDTLSEDLYYNPFFFMDVNFDGEAEFVVAHQGYNRTYYTCFDLVNGNRHEPSIGILSPMDEEPYNNIVGGMCGRTEFDYQNQIIHIFENMGCTASIETWAKPIKTEYDIATKVRIYKRIEKEYHADGSEHITEYGLVNGSLEEISHKVELKK